MNRNSATLIDISTTQNDLPGKHQCPVQIGVEYLTFDPFDYKKTFMQPMDSRFFEIIPDEPMMPGGVLQIGKTPDFNDGTYIDLNDALKNVYSLLWESLDAGHVFVAYNIPYDIGILNEHFQRILGEEPISIPNERIIDIMDLAKKVISVEKISSYTEKNVFYCLYKNVELLNKLSMKYSGTKLDNQLSKMILFAICKMKKFGSFSEMVEFVHSVSMIEVFPFGKYKGEKISEVYEKDQNYVQWCLGQKKILENNPDLKYTLEKMTSSDVEI
jgi:hypothetical protein